MGNDASSPLLAKLKQSVLFAQDFPRRRRYSHAEWAGLDEDERTRSHEPGLDAIRRAKNFQELADVVRQLGKNKAADAVPLLAELWANGALQPVRQAAGHALRAIATPEARRALQQLIGDADHLSVYLAVAAVFDEDAAKAFNRFSPYFEPTRVAQPGGEVIPNAVLSTFAPSSFVGGSTPRWSQPDAPAWLRQDPRWLKLCIALRHDKRLGETAREVLKYADPDLVAPALAEAKSREGPRAVHAATRTSGDLVARYRRGEHEAVWTELRSHSALAGDLLAETRAVASETMKRVAHNADLLAERLAAHGWKPLSGNLRTRPTAEDQEVMRRMEQETGAPLPVSLRAFWETVGGINFVWDYNAGHPPSLGVDLPMNEMDPLCVDPPGDAAHAFDEWTAQRAGVDPELVGPFNLDLAPDYLHKADISGGAPYGVELPFLGADPVFANEAHELPFVDYLRLCFRWAAFPRLERHADRADVREFVRRMSEGMEPL